ncbi:hypothetical protein [Streptomyces diastatochromogenes]|uniref:hypothetical protein n=1 Tax=Streptomyces diastatochromogenes TaxID=42236 RepID=UPI0036767112
MSDDYASLIITVVIAVLAVGTVQLYTLMNRWGQVFVTTSGRRTELRLRTLQAMTEGRQADEGDLKELADKWKWWRSLLRAVPPYLAAGIWGALCALNVGVAIRVLQWSGQDGHGKDPQLAEHAYWVAVASIGTLMFEGLVRSFLTVGGRMASNRRRLRSFSTDDRDRLYELIDHYQQTGQTQLPPPAPPTSAPQPTLPSP